MLATGFSGKEAKSRAIPPAFVEKHIAERTHRSLDSESLAGSGGVGL